MFRLAALIFAATLLTGCVTYDFLDPRGAGSTFTVNNPCHYPYRVLEVRSKRDRSVRILINVFRAGGYSLKSPTLFVVVSDRTVAGSETGQFQLRPMKKEHRVAFPNGRTIVVAFRDGTTTSGQLEVGSDGRIFSYSFSSMMPDGFVITLPPIDVDGELITLGDVQFSRGAETLYAINC